MSTDDAFVFINTSDPRLPANHGTRLTIRKQAMAKAAAARKQKGNYGKVNLLQRPPQESDVTDASNAKPDQSDTPRREAHRVTGRYREQITKSITIESDPSQSAAVASAAPTSLEHASLQRPTIPGSMPLTGYEAMRAKSNVDILDLSALTTYHVSRITAQQLATKPSYLINILRHRQWSFLSYVPSRWGNTLCLDHAVCCVVSRVQDYLSSPTGLPSPQSLKQYALAIARLQKALGDPHQATSPDVLCATEVMALYELLASWKPKAWEYHVSGAASLIRLRGPKGYSSNYEKALLLGQVGPLFTEATINDKRCFLESPEWQYTLQSCVLEPDSTSDCGQISVSMWLIVTPIPSILHEIQAMICNPDVARPIATITFVSRLHKIHSELRTWRHQYNDLLNKYPGADKRLELLGVCLGSLLLISRLLVVLGPRCGQAYEDDAQDYADQIFQLELQAVAINPRAGLFMGFKMALANATLGTKAEWQMAIWNAESGTDGGMDMIPRALFEQWCQLKGRKVSNSEAE